MTDNNSNQQEVKNPSNSNTPSHKTDQPFFIAQSVVKGGRKHIQITFDTLIFQRKERPFDWYKKLDLDKSLGSKIRRGFIIPPRWLRIKIADYFGVDTSMIWYSAEMVLTDGGEE